MSKSSMYLAILTIIFAPLATKAQDFDPEAVSQVSKAIAEWKLMNDTEAEEQQVYVSSSLSPKVEMGTGQVVNGVIGVSAFGQDYASMELELQRMRSYDFRTNITFAPLKLDRALEAERTAKIRFDRMRINRISRPQISFPEAAAVQDLRRKGLEAAYWTPSNVIGPSRNIVLPGQQLAVTKHDVYHGYWHPGIFTDRFSSRNFVRYGSLADSRDIRKVYIINTRDKTISFYDARHPVSLGKDWMVAGGISVVDHKSYTWGVADWSVYNREMEAAKYMPRGAPLDQVVRLETSFQYEDAVKMQFGTIGRQSYRTSMDPYRIGIPMGKWDRSLQQYYNRIGAGSSFYMPSYARPRTSYSNYSTIGQRH